MMITYEFCGDGLVMVHLKFLLFFFYSGRLIQSGFLLFYRQNRVYFCNNSCVNTYQNKEKELLFRS